MGFTKIDYVKLFLLRKVFIVSFPEESENQVRFFIFFQEKREDRKIQKMKIFQNHFFELKINV